MKCKSFWLGVYLFLISYSVPLFAQSNPIIPTLTTEDVVTVKLPPPETKSNISNPGNEINKSIKKDSEATSEKKNQALISENKKDSDTGKIEKDTVSKPEENIEEKNWNNKLLEAQERAKSLARQANQAELEIGKLKNQLHSAVARTTSEQGQIMSRINQLAGQASKLKAEAEAAQKETDAIMNTGSSQGYKVTPPALTTEKGEPDANSYRNESARLQTEIQDAQAAIEVLQLQLNKIRAESIQKANGDNFTINRLKVERQNVEQEIEKNQKKIEETALKLQLHQQKAAVLGISLLPR